jgi:Fe-S cluster biogenesis protein NfuA
MSDVIPLPDHMPQGTEVQMRDLVETLSAYIEHYHGGWVHYISFDGHVLTVEMGGACLGCPLSPGTLHGWVEGTVRQFFPELEAVRALEAIPSA